MSQTTLSKLHESPEQKKKGVGDTRFVCRARAPQRPLGVCGFWGHQLMVVAGLGFRVWNGG